MASYSPAVNPVNRATEALATAYFVWNPNPCFSLGVWANWEYNSNGSVPLGTNGAGNLVQAGGSRNIVSAGIRPVWWIADNIAIQGVAAGSYIDNVRTILGHRMRSGTVERRASSPLHPRSSPRAGSSPGLRYGCSQRMRSGVII